MILDNLIETKRAGSIYLIGINRPSQRNCVNPRASLELVSAFKDFEDDNELKVAILYGVGGNFCSGYDLKAMSCQDEDIAVQMPQVPDGMISPQSHRFMVKMNEIYIAVLYVILNA